MTPAIRYSYLVGAKEPTHTAQKRLLSILKDDSKLPTIDEIEDIFSVEKVTNEFFEQYKEKYLQLKEHLQQNNEFIVETRKLGLDVDKFAEQFSKKLMGQIAFLYFLQKKGWLGVRILPKNRMLSLEEYKDINKKIDLKSKDILNKVFKYNSNCKAYYMDSQSFKELSEDQAIRLSMCFNNTKFDKTWGTGDKQFIRGLFKFCEENTELNFFDDYLEPFFYEALNTKRKNSYYQRFNCKIPFLNGGLFEPIEDYHWEEISFEIPNSIFSNQSEKGMYSDGILDIFDRYNFTMNEAEPLEKEVAVDPEMLGKIFENLLDVNDRKSKGAFYTPREIVHYMCQESLINYLVNKVGVPYGDIKEFILYGEMIRDEDGRIDVVREGKELRIKSSIYKNIVEIDEALKTVKVADPAVGSGAFPLGMLNEIVKARNNITEYIIKINKEGQFGKKYDESFIRNRRSQYKMKWETIRNCIFAVDIEPSAVDISKLRLWLSVVVEQEIDVNNPKPHTLPNLDQNIMVGNSLIDEFEGIKLFDKTLMYKKDNKDKRNINVFMQMNMLLDQSDELLDNMFKLQDQYFDEDNEHRKKTLKVEIEKIRDELIRYKLQNEGNIEGLRKYEESLKKKTKPYFIWELEFAKIFKENGGFDIVIGNPPYLESRNSNFDNKTKDVLGRIIKDRYPNDYIFFARGADLLVYFFELSLRIMKKDGVNVFITQNSWLDTNYGKKFQEFLIKTTNVLAIIDSDFKYFENVNINTVITVFEGRNGFNKDIMFTRCHTSLEEYSLPINNNIKSNKDAIIKIISKSNPLLKELKWGFIFESNEQLLKVIERCNQLGMKIDDFKGEYSIGQGLNITKNFLVEREEVQNMNIMTENLIPIMTVKESGYYEWNYTNTFLIKNNSLTKEQIILLKSMDIRMFDEVKTSKMPPALIIPRGIGARHFCSYNKIGGYSSSFVDIYRKDGIKLTKEVLNMWVFLNSTLSWLLREVSGRKNLGGGMLKAEATDLKSFPIYYDFSNLELIKNLYENAVGVRLDNAQIEINKAIHREIDNIVFNHLGLSKETKNSIIHLFMDNINSRYKKVKNK